MILQEYTRAIVVHDLPELGLAIGDVGTIVHIHTDVQNKPVGYMLETFSVDGESLDTVSVGIDDVRSASSADRMHARHAA
jgi:Domain of unknown function (DUF4926)